MISGKIPVCSECLMASCWQGVFMCEKNRTAGVVYKTRQQLRKLSREHPSYWKTEKELCQTH